MNAIITDQRRRIAKQRQADFEAWRHERLQTDPRLGALRALRHDVRAGGVIGEATWQRFRNEKRSRAAEALVGTHHARPDYYVFDPEQRAVVISEGDGVRPRYTMREIYENGLQKSRELAEQDPRFAFQARRDEIFMQVYEQVEAMLAGETDFDHIRMVSSFPVDELGHNLDAVGQKHYDLQYGKQFKYDFKAIRQPNGAVVLEMLATTLYCPQSDLEPGGTAYGKVALAVMQRFQGADAPFEMLSSHEQNAYISTSTTADRPLADISAEDVAVYDEALQALTGQEYDHGRIDPSMEAYALFEHCQSDWDAYDNLYEMLAQHLEGAPLDPQLQHHLVNLMAGYMSAHRINAALTEAEFNQLFDSVRRGSIPVNLELACNEILDYAHNALLYRRLVVYKESGLLPGERGGDALGGYSGAAGEANATAAAMDMDFNDCEFGNSVTSTTQTAMAMAKAEGISFSEAMNKLVRARERKMAGDSLKCVRCPLPGCGKTVDAMRVRHKGKDGIACPECRRGVWKGGGRFDLNEPEQSTTQVAAQTGKRARAGDKMRVGGAILRYQEKIAVGGTYRYMADENGQEVVAGWL